MDLLEQTLYSTLISISDTWFLEVAGGDESHVFDLHVTSEAVRGAGRFKFHRVIDGEGSIVRTGAVGETTIEPSVIEIRNLEVKEPVVLAFKLMQSKAPVEFDLKIDGRSAISNTFIGKELLQPMMMPFTEKAPPPESETTSLGSPAGRPDGPYCLIWLHRSQYQEEADITLDEETKRELRALGYIQ
jgi:hypothetical protein